MQEHNDKLETSSARVRDAAHAEVEELRPGQERVLELREEQLVADKQLRDLGEIIVRTEVETVPAQLELDVRREEVEIEHEAVGQAVGQREDPREENGVLVVPVYEEQLVVSKRLVLRERLRIRRIGTSERQLFQDTVRRDRLVIDDPQQTRLVHEVYPHDEARAETEHAGEEEDAAPEDESATNAEGGFFTRLVTKALE